MAVKSAEFKRKSNTTYLQLLISILFGILAYFSIDGIIPFYGWLFIAIFVGGTLESIWNLAMPILKFDDSGFYFCQDMFRRKKQYKWDQIKGITKITSQRVIIDAGEKKPIVIHLVVFDPVSQKEIVELFRTRVGLIDSMNNN